MVSDPRKTIRFPAEILGYFSDLRKFKCLGGSEEKIELHPVLFQKGISSTFDAHYVYQSAWAVRRIHALRPREHFDISSNIPYVAALSAVVPVRFCEYRPPQINLPDLRSEHVDITSLPLEEGSIDSLSCLHVLEHIGLGRYGDPVDPQGFEKACKEIARVAAPGASVFLSIPVGREKICFNMHRVSDPLHLISVMKGKLELHEFSVVTDDRQYLVDVSPESYSSQEYACGLYWFKKAPNA